jgi:hypothetical protein
MITDTDVNIQEACFYNGERHMKDKAISVLMDIKTQMSHPYHVHVGDIIKVIEKL